MLATRWKKFSRKALTKAVLFLLFVVSLMVGVLAALTIYLSVQNYESIALKDYMKSKALSDELKYAADRLEYVLSYYKSEAYIKSGGTVKDIKIKDSWQLTNLYNNFMAENKYDDSLNTESLFWREKKDEIEEIKNTIIKSDLANYEQTIYDLKNQSGLIYYAEDKENICTNTNNDNKSHYALKNAFLLIDGEGVNLKPDNGQGTYSQSLLDRFRGIEEGTDATKIYICITDEGLASRINKWNLDRYNLTANITVIILCTAAAAALLISLVFVAGKRSGDEEIHFIFIDRVLTDINLIMIASVVTACVFNFNSIMNIRYTDENFMKLVMLLVVTAASVSVLGLLLSLVKHVKKGDILKYSLLYIVLSKIARALIQVINGGPLMVKTIAAIIALMAGSMIGTIYPVAIIFVMVIAIYAAYTKVSRFKAIQYGIKMAKDGDYEYKIKLEGGGEFKQLSDEINSMTDGLKTAVENEVKSERFKTELITNVSHDIRTPLTSIISYVDLLKREGLESPNAPRYLDVLDHKSNRLKILTEDLFEAAKATSGSIEVNFDKVDVNELMSQILGEMDEKIQESRLELKVGLPEEKVYANADGRLLGRVMENLLSNIFKYALEGSRVYVDVHSSDKDISVCFKNVSAYQLNIPVNELMERFIRGDQSRNSEGSGLGLAIARSLMEIQKGTLELSIDGDLFKAEIKLNKYFEK